MAVVRGYLNTTEPADGAGASVLVRDAELDLFSLGTAEARASGLRAAATLPETAPTGAGSDGTGVDPVAVRRAIATVADAVAPGTVFTPVTREEVRDPLGVPDRPVAAISMVLCTAPGEVTATAGTLIRFGADLHRLRAALAAEGVASSVTTAPADSTASAALTL